MPEFVCDGEPLADHGVCGVHPNGLVVALSEQQAGHVAVKALVYEGDAEPVGDFLDGDRKLALGVLRAELGGLALSSGHRPTAFGPGDYVRDEVPLVWR